MAIKRSNKREKWKSNIKFSTQGQIKNHFLQISTCVLNSVSMEEQTIRLRFVNDLQSKKKHPADKLVRNLEHVQCNFERNVEYK